MAETANQQDALETWKNIGKARHVIKKFSVKGDLIDEMITGGRQFHLTTRERHINMETAANPGQDPFSNGMFSPVRLLDDTEDAAQIAANPNLINESEMVGLLKYRIDAFRRRLEDINNTVVLDRLMEVATENDAPVSKIEAVKARLSAVSPALFIEQHPPEAGPAGGGGAGRAVGTR